jgi:hypothetical protein
MVGLSMYLILNSIHEARNYYYTLMVHLCEKLFYLRDVIQVIDYYEAKAKGGLGVGLIYDIWVGQRSHIG